MGILRSDLTRKILRRNQSIGSYDRDPDSSCHGMESYSIQTAFGPKVKYLDHGRLQRLQGWLDHSGFSPFKPVIICMHKEDEDENWIEK